MRRVLAHTVTRRVVLGVLGGAALLGSARGGLRLLARPMAPSGPLSQAARELVAWAWEGLDPKMVLDTHVHIAGIGAGGTGCFVHEHMRSPLHPRAYAQFLVYREASGIAHLDRADAEFVERLISLLEGMSPRGRALLMAFDKAHDDAGRPDLLRTEFFVPNDYVFRLCEKRPDLFIPCASIHPYREDAVVLLEEACARGAVAVKWLPNAMNIDPSSPRCDPFYDALSRLSVTLISHTGVEKAVHAEEMQRLGNPLLLRRPLSRGVRVIAAHCASLGESVDLDRTGQPSIANFELFVRLFGEEAWRGQLFADISAMPQANRVGEPLRRVIVETAWHDRLLNASDYPLPAIHVLMQTRAIEKAGFITARERLLLNEIDQHNPLLFDFVLKRALTAEGKRLSNSVFTTARKEIFPRLRTS